MPCVDYYTARLYATYDDTLSCSCTALKSGRYVLNNPSRDHSLPCRTVLQLFLCITASAATETASPRRLTPAFYENLVLPVPQLRWCYLKLAEELCSLTFAVVSIILARTPLSTASSLTLRRRDVSERNFGFLSLPLALRRYLEVHLCWRQHDILPLRLALCRLLLLQSLL